VAPDVVTKTRRDAPAGFFEAEARGLDLLRVPGGPAIARVVDVRQDAIDVERIPTAAATAEAAEDFGCRLAVLHRSGLPSYGASNDGFIGPFPLPNDRNDDWASFYVEQRLAPYLSGLSAQQRRPVEQVCAQIVALAGPAESPSRIHGDLWSGNLLWGADGQVWLIDAASAHGGHRETDLAMLALFGAPHLDRIIASYDATAPLADGWRDRVGLHQLHPLLVHAVLFGGSYGDQVARAAESQLDRLEAIR
jgi:fructosamine-3-kinase